MSKSYIIKYYNKINGDFIGYESNAINNLPYISKEIEYASIIDNIDTVFAYNLLCAIIKNKLKKLYCHYIDNTLNNRRKHIIKNNFNNLKLEDIDYKIITYDSELRILKIKKINE